MMICFDDMSPEIMESMCTPMHRILPTSSPASVAVPSKQNSHPLGSLYLGSISATMDRELLSSHKITHLVQVLDAPWVPITEKDGFRCLRISILDAPTADLRPHLEGACNFISNALQAGSNVLVHCQQGVSRSSSVVIAYLIHNLGMSYDQAFALVKKRRPCIRPNTGFVSVLRAWEGKWRAQVAASTPASPATAAPQIRRFNTSYMGLHHHSNSPHSMASPSGSSSPAAPSSTSGAGKHVGGAGSASASASAASSTSSPSSGAGGAGHAGGIAAPSMARGVSYAGHGNAPTFTLKAPPAFHMKHRASAAAPHAVTPVHAS
ncbi:phosphatases II [Coniophora puteana RWD-64-598 SS2]|uniref:protein-tyrosine-phosphatase n=1 Tax=Coniophora puteana (strain RWD-64-598) TaxID=741705 RepID=A0A5M3MSB2_CONPW|nr:phosphatases II [Coniophora puteana RWD-64-598 SS2]EIW81634.1 phosphatases II [Coniophora puteana RWD-64-598 SS2]